MTPSRSQRARKPETILRRLDVSLRNARTYLVDLQQVGEGVVLVIEARALLAELRRALNKEKRP